MKKALILLLAALTLTACTSKPSDVDASKYVDNLTFVKHKNGLCFAVSNTINTAGNVNVILTWVPCEALKGEAK